MRVDATDVELPGWPDRGWKVPGLRPPQGLGAGTGLASDDAGTGYALRLQRFSLAISPNPARGAFTARFALPEGRPARLDLLDVGGRRIWGRDVGGAGAHALAIEPAGDLAPGVYLARLTQGGDHRTVRIAVVR